MANIERQQGLQRFIYKIHSTRLVKSRWDLKLSIPEAMKNNEIVPMADSSMLRYMDKLNQLINSEDKVRELKNRIKVLQSADIANKKQDLRKLYAQLHTLQFNLDYVCLIMDKNSDYDRAFEKGFKINGIPYSRLLATNGGVKRQTIVFTSERLKPALRMRIECGRKMDIPLVPAKYGAYESLDCSSTIAVSDPKVIVVKDCETSFYEDVIKLDDSDSEEPILSFEKNYNIHKNASDGYGLMLPNRAKLWAKELDLDYIPAGLGTRPWHWSKGMLVTFDFHDFADKVSHSHIITDVWGIKRDIREADVILTASMVKLWNCYGSWEDFYGNCKKYNFTFDITKISPKELEHERNLNYQFIQSYHLTDEEIDKLIEPTVTEIKEVLGEDPMKSILFLRGMGITDENAFDAPLDYIKALQIEPQMAKDPYVRACIHRMIQHRIDGAKTGAIKVKGNYQIACGDPYALCQSIFSLKITGLLDKGEFYSHYWTRRDVHHVIAFRAPMICHNNIRKLKLFHTKEQAYWYRFINTMVIFNSWDTAAEAMCGEDFDADMNLLVDDSILLEKHRELPTILCIQRKAEKKDITEKQLVQSNKESFGDDIGVTTNGITAQFHVQSHFPVDSMEYKEMNYRIMCGQLYQQNCIDKAKGILAKPRPKSWFEYRPSIIKDSDTKEERAVKDYNRRLIADKKPYFMIYIYPTLQSLYKKYRRDADKKCQIEFQINLEELMDRTEKKPAEEKFLMYYYKKLPVGNYGSVMNRICWKFEKIFDPYLKDFRKETQFDYSILKSSLVDETSKKYKTTKTEVSKIYKQYCDRVTNFMQQARTENLKTEEMAEQRGILVEIFKQECTLACPNNTMLCNIVLSICYNTTASKQFAWDISGAVFVKNLLIKNNYYIKYPTLCPEGEIVYRGHRFTGRGKQLPLY